MLFPQVKIVSVVTVGQRISNYIRKDVSFLKFVNSLKYTYKVISYSLLCTQINAKLELHECHNPVIS